MSVSSSIKKKEAILKAPDKGLLSVVVLLLIIGVLLVFDASYGKTGDSKWFNFDVRYMVKRQFIFAGVGFVFMQLASKIKLKVLAKCAPYLLGFAIVALAIVLFKGNEVNGAKRWFKLGMLSIQPSEFANVAVVLYISNLIASGKINVRRLGEKLILPAFAIVAVLLLIFKEPDMGTALTVAATCIIMFIAAGMRFSWICSIIAGSGVLCWIAVLTEPFRMKRILVFLNPWVAPFGEGFQVIHSLIALGTGGLTGVGVCEGREKLYIPAASTDFIFATLGEELGLIGGIVLLVLFGYLTYRGIEIARKSKSTFGSLAAIGLTAMISMQAIINIAVVSASMPATGVPLPFMSYGGSSLMTMMIGVGLLLGISRQADVEMKESEVDESSNNRRRHRRPHLSGNKRRPNPKRPRQ